MSLCSIINLAHDFKKSTSRCRINYFRLLAIPNFKVSKFVNVANFQTFKDFAVFWEYKERIKNIYKNVNIWSADLLPRPDLTNSIMFIEIYILNLHNLHHLLQYHFEIYKWLRLQRILEYWIWKTAKIQGWGILKLFFSLPCYPSLPEI